MFNYDLDVFNPNNSSEYIKLKLHLTGESTGQHLYISSSASTTSISTNSISTLTTTPGLELVFLSSGFACLAIIYKMKLHK